MSILEVFLYPTEIPRIPVFITGSWNDETKEYRHSKMLILGVCLKLLGIPRIPFLYRVLHDGIGWEILIVYSQILHHLW